MSGLDSWEDDPQEENLAQHTQQMNINPQTARGAGSSFTPNANTFQPGAQSFQPGGYGQSQQYSQYYYNQQQPQYGGAYPQYGQQNYGQYDQGYSQQPNTFNQGYAPQQQQAQQRQVPIIAKRPSAADSAPAASAPPSKTTDASGPPVVKTLSIGAETSGAAAPKTKVLSVGVPTPPPAAPKDVSAADGAKITAAKKIEKSAPAANGQTSPSPSSGRSSPTAVEAREAKREADAVARDQAAMVDEEVLEEVYGKEHVNLIFIGHVDAGKSTLGGSILYATGMVDERTMDKYKREAKEAGRETWYLSYVFSVFGSPLQCRCFSRKTDPRSTGSILRSIRQLVVYSNVSIDEVTLTPKSLSDGPWI